MPKFSCFIVSVGGSLLAPKQGINWRFLKQLRALLLTQTKQGKKFFLVAGGGVVAREYVAAIRRIIAVRPQDQDWLGIQATRLNAHLLRTVLFDVAYQKIIKDPTIRLRTSKKIVVAGGWKPGFSTDYVAVLLAHTYKVKTVINLTNTDYVYNKDPRQYKNAQPIKEISWAEFSKIIPSKWKPGLNAPFDPVAAKKAQSLGLKVIIMSGKTNDLEKYLAGSQPRGTIIS
jgi:uridylate kinase